MYGALGITHPPQLLRESQVAGQQPGPDSSRIHPCRSPGPVKGRCSWAEIALAIYSRASADRAPVGNRSVAQRPRSSRIRRGSLREDADARDGLRSGCDSRSMASVVRVDRRSPRCPVSLVPEAGSALEVEELLRLWRVPERIRHLQVGRDIVSGADLEPFVFAGLQNATLGPAL